MKSVVKRLLMKVPFTRSIIERRMRFPPGHYYSPVPDRKDVLAYTEAHKGEPPARLPGINTCDREQLSLLEEFAEFYDDVHFERTKVPSRRYYWDNRWFGYTDAFYLYCFLRKHRPDRIIEVGSGFSSAVILDTVDAVFDKKPEITMIEPYPTRVRSLLSDDDLRQLRLIEKRVQDVSLEVFAGLESGDLLFIDSSHVLKCGSDVQVLLFDVLPQLSKGVTVHFHDVHYPFEYPGLWLREELYWNESYFLRAFLSYNSEWHILLFVDYMGRMHGDLLKKSMPMCAEQPGGSLYISMR